LVLFKNKQALESIQRLLKSLIFLETTIEEQSHVLRKT